MSIYWQLLRIAAKLRSQGYLVSYRDDLIVHDKRELARKRAGQKLLWMIQAHSTSLFTVGGGWSPQWITAWFEPSLRSGPEPRIYLIEVGENGAGKVHKIGRVAAFRLAATPHPDGFVFSLDFGSMKTVAQQNGQKCGANVRPDCAPY